MLPKVDLEKKENHNSISLVMNTGIQFVDFALKIDWKDKYWREKSIGCFVLPSQANPVRRLIEDKHGEGYCDPSNISQLVKPQFEYVAEESFKLYADEWLPIPVLRAVPPDRFDEGPFNWARVRFVQLPEPDEDGNTHRITFAFDTKAFPNSADIDYLAPTEEDVNAGAKFDLAFRSNQMSWFLDKKWVKEWLKEVYLTRAVEKERLKLYPDDAQAEMDKYHAQEAHYLNVLEILGTELGFPRIEILSNKSDDIKQNIPVDMVLDVGNSRTCGILVEDNEQDRNGLNSSAVVMLRDLNQPENVYIDPFESRVEFAQAFFGKDHCSQLSGRRDAFQWASIVRIGKEANRLASRREGNEGSTGLSSPKRYLWDRDEYIQGWRFNTTYVKSDTGTKATLAPLSNLVNSFGEALHILDDNIEEEAERKWPVFDPNYSCSSLMTFMLVEVIMQVLMQINSVKYRNNTTQKDRPRTLRSVILTVPPAMPKPERDIFESAMYQALGLVWKSLGWDKSDDDLDFTTAESRGKYWPILPYVKVQWDESTCGQIVYLFNETYNNYSGRPDDFIKAMVRPDKVDKSRLTIASIDIGGGTTDLIINDYFQEAHSDDSRLNSNTPIKPEQRFRDGFKVAGDDILLDVIRKVVLETLEKGLKSAGLNSPNALLSELIGANKLSVKEQLLRQQLTLQVFMPMGLYILKEYEKYSPYDSEPITHTTFNALLADVEAPTQLVLDFINRPIQKALRAEGMINDEFNILDLPISVNLQALHNDFVQGKFDICKTLKNLCEIVSLYQCDVLLLTGRPSRLPGIQAFFKGLMPVPAGRILPLQNYRTGTWYPFHCQGRIDDPKTTASVGALLCFLSLNNRLSNFAFRSNELLPKSTVRYIGSMDTQNLVIKKENEYFQGKNIDLDNDERDFLDEPIKIYGSTRIGYRQLDNDRWIASPMYKIDIISAEASHKVNSGDFISVQLGTRKAQGSRSVAGSEDFYIRRASYASGGKCEESLDGKTGDIRLTLNTMMTAELGEKQYWLDSGSIKQEK